MPSYRHHELGDLYVALTVNFPDALDEVSFPLLEAALPMRPALDPPGHMDVEEVFLEAPDPNKQRRREDAMEEDEPGQQGVQCAQQ